ncbi:MAG: hypothetical protein ACE5L7_01635 [Candidatus Aminicenantales bacterium]
MREEKDVSCAGLFAYGLVITFFHIMPALLSSYLMSPLTWGDTLDFLTPFAVIPLAYLIFRHTQRVLKSSYALGRIKGLGSKIILALGILLYVDGHGLHLSANSIARLLQSMKGSELFRATYLFDEIISHFMWDAGVFLISLSLIIVAVKLPYASLSRRDLIFIFIGAAFYGFNFTVNGIEGQTVVLNFPGAFLGCLLSLVLYLRGRKEGVSNPFHIYFSAAYFVSVALFAYWGVSNSGFPQFSELGWIR